VLRVAGLLLLGVGCGSPDICTRREDADLGCGEVHPPEETEACQSDLDLCSRQDQKILDNYADCYEEAGVYACSPTDEQFTAALDCLALIDNLSSACIIPLGAL
jgi:hypothetical protein